MGLVLESDGVELACAWVFIFWLTFVYIVKPYDYWPQRGVPYIPPIFPIGSLPRMVFNLDHYCVAVDKAYQTFKHERFFGLTEVRIPCLAIIDPELIKDVLCKNFSHFTDRSLCGWNGSDESLYHNVVTMQGEEWKDMRTKLSPAYTACKVRMMFMLVRECCDHLQAVLEDKLAETNTVDVQDMVDRYTIDVIGSCAFGSDIHTLSNQDSKFYKVAKTLMRHNKLQFVKLYLTTSFPILRKIPFFRLIDPENKSYITKHVRSMVSYRETNNVRRLDFMDLLIKIKQNESILDDDDSTTNNHKNGDVLNRKHHKNEGMVIEQMAAETFVFFAAGFETTSSAITFCLYELACNPSIQERLLSEVEEVLSKYEGEITYPSLNEMQYLDQVVNETLRHYPPFSFLSRCCTQSYKVPKSDMVINEGVRIMIPVYSLHHDPRYFHDPEVFDPDRFSAKNCQERQQCVYLPFGEGPRMCLGLKFGLTLVKAAVVSVVNSYALSLAPDTPVPVVIDPSAIVLQSYHPLKLAFTPR